MHCLSEISFQHDVVLAFREFLARCILRSFSSSTDAVLQSLHLLNYILRVSSSQILQFRFQFCSFPRIRQSPPYFILHLCCENVLTAHFPLTLLNIFLILTPVLVYKLFPVAFAFQKHCVCHRQRSIVCILNGINRKGRLNRRSSPSKIHDFIVNALPTQIHC